LSKDVEKLLQKYISSAQSQGVDLDTLGEQQLKYIIQLNKPQPPKVYSGQEAIDQLNKIFPKKGEVVDMTGKTMDTSQGIMGGRSVKELMESGQITKGTAPKQSNKVRTRQMFKDSNLNKTDTVTDTITYIKTLEPIDAMKEANSIIGRKGKYKNLTPEESKKILTDTEDHIFERDIPIDPEDMATGGRAGYYMGGQAMVGEDLSDIGHGSDSLMARNMQLSPGSQATTSTGLNYLLGQDNDTARVPYSEGGPARQNFAMGKRAFLKFLGAGAAGIAGIKTGLLGLGKKEVAKEVVKEAATSGGVPPYFLNLVKKIKTLGDDAPNLVTQDRQKVTKFKNYQMTEDVSTGNIEILKKERGGFREDVYMSYKVDDVPIKGKKGSSKVEEYEEYTARPDQDGKMRDVEPGVPDEVVEEANRTLVEEAMEQKIKIGKADGGRIGYSGGGILRAIIAKSAASKGLSVRDFIKATSYKGLPPEIKMYISVEDFARLKSGQKEMYDNFIDMAKTRKSFQENVEGGKGTPVEPLFKNLEKTMDEQSFVPKTVTADDIAEMEIMVRNRFEKGRKLQATGGLATMLGE
jgi:hypothetical protein